MVENAAQITNSINMATRIKESCLKFPSTFNFTILIISILVFLGCSQPLLMASSLVMEEAIIPNSSNMEIGPRVSLAVDSSGIPHVSGVINNQGLYYFTGEGTTWQKELIDTQGRCSSLFLGPQGQPSIVYASQEGLCYATRQSANSWSQNRISTDFGWPHWGVRQSDGVLHVVFTGADGKFYYATQGTSAYQWQKEYISEESANYVVPWIGIGENAELSVLREENNCLYMSCREQGVWKSYLLYAPSTGASLVWLSGALTDTGQLQVAVGENPSGGQARLKWGYVGSNNQINWSGSEETLGWSDANLPVAFIQGQPVAIAHNSSNTPVLVCGSEKAILDHTSKSGSVFSLTTTTDGKIYAAYIERNGSLLLAKQTGEGSTVYVNGVSLNSNELSLQANEQSVTLQATVSPENASNKTLTWSSDHPGIASVNSYGEVKPLSPGVAHITATSVDGDFSGSCTVTVQADGTPPAVVSTNPTEGSTNFEIDQDIVITFSENIKAGLNYSSFSLSNNTAQVACTTSITDNTLHIHPTGALSESSTYTLQISTGAVCDLAGNTWPDGLVLHFTAADSPPVISWGSIITTMFSYDSNGEAIGCAKTYPFNVTGGSGEATINVQRFIDGGTITIGGTQLSDTFNLIAGHSYNLIFNTTISSLHMLNYTFIKVTADNSPDFTDIVTNQYLGSFYGLRVEDLTVFTEASFTASSDRPQVGSSISFDASVSSGTQGSSMTYNWDFGDGSSATGVQANHSYAKAGVYQAALNVTNSNGTSDTETKTIYVPEDRPDKLNQSADKEWSVQFSHDLDTSTITSNNIFVSTDADGRNQVSGVNPRINSANSKTVLISPPTGGWPAGTYYLQINSGLKSSNASGGKFLSHPVRMKFTV